MEPNITIKQVEHFWSNHPCGADESHAEDRKRYFGEIEQKRYREIPHIVQVVNFNKFNGKKVLEVGCGIGTDGRQFAKNGAIYTGINLDRGSVELAKEAFFLFRLKGRILQMNAEEMEFYDHTFDHVFSLGVIHHSPNPEKIIEEMYRVLKPEGAIQVMVYNKRSINYYIHIMFMRKVFRLILIPQFMPKIISKLTGLSEYKLKRHREIYLEEKMTKDRWISINTDGPDNSLSRVYSSKQITDLFEKAGFHNIKTYVKHFDRKLWPFIRYFMSDRMADWLGNRWGWCRWVEAIKPIQQNAQQIL